MEVLGEEVGEREQTDVMAELVWELQAFARSRPVQHKHCGGPCVGPGQRTRSMSTGFAR